MLINVISKCWGIFDRKRRFHSSLMFGLMVLSGAIEFFGLASVAVFLGYVLDPVSLNSNDKFIFVLNIFGFNLGDVTYYSLGFWAIAALIFGVVFNFIVQVGIVFFGATITRDLTCNAIRMTLSAPVSWHSKQNSSEIAQRLLQDASSIGGTVFPAILEFAYSMVMIAIALVIIFSTSSLDGLLMISVCGVVAVFAVYKIRNSIQIYSANFRRMIEGVTRLGVESFLGAKEIKIKTREMFYVEKYMNLFSGANLYRCKINVLFRIVPTFFMLFGQVGMISVVLALFSSGVPREDVLQQVTLLAVIISRLLPSLTRLTSTIGNIATGKPFLDGYQSQMSELMGLADFERNASSSNLSVNQDWRCLELKNVSFEYVDSRKKALSNINLKILRGQSYAFVGRSGAGKSTIVDMIMGLQLPSSGALTLDGGRLVANSPSWFRKIGYVAQFPFLSDDTILANVAFGIREEDVDEARVWECLALAGLKEFVEDFPDKLLAIVGDKGVRFSGGQRQRLAIARALYDSPELLVFDEATSALDVLTERSIQDTLQSLRGTVTTITIAHRLSTVVDCDELFLLNEGQLVAAGTFEALKESSELFRAMVLESGGQVVG